MFSPYIAIFQHMPYVPKTIVLATDRVPVARFGPKLGQNESYGLQFLF